MCFHITSICEAWYVLNATYVAQFHLYSDNSHLNRNMSNHNLPRADLCCSRAEPSTLTSWGHSQRHTMTIIATAIANAVREQGLIVKATHYCILSLL